MSPILEKSQLDLFGWNDPVEVNLASGQTPQKGCLYVRTAYRNDPDFTLTGISKPSSPSEQVRFHRVIENDQTVSDSYQRLVYDTMSGVYDANNDNKSVIELREELIGKIRTSMRNVFGDLVLNSISDPLGSGAFFFEKGAAKSYHYKNLSGGEKAAFDLILDLHVKGKFFSDTVFCVDELETHLHTRVQGSLLREMVTILPDRSQLWVTTHSLGVLRAAQLMATDDPGSVCLIDFDAIDPDEPRQIVPSSLGRVAWEKMLSVSLDDLTPRVAPRTVVVCEGSITGSRRKDFDAEIYNRVLGSQDPDVLFISGGSSNQVAAAGISIEQTLRSIVPAARIYALCDRDDKSNAEVSAFEQFSGIVLGERNLESYLFADDVIEALLQKEGKVALLAQALQIKSDALQASINRNNAKDDLKSAAGEVYTKIKQLAQLTRCGNNTDTFMRDTLAPLINPSLATYAKLKSHILDRLQ